MFILLFYIVVLLCIYLQIYELSGDYPKEKGKNVCS